MSGDSFDEEYTDPHGECAYEIKRLKTRVRKLELALRPFVNTAKNIPEHWRGDVWLRNQVIKGSLPLVSDYRYALKVAEEE